MGFGCQNATVWGSGLLSPDPFYLKRLKLAKLDIRAVRGPKTRAVLLKIKKQCPAIYGDPAILMPIIYKPQNNEKQYEVSLISHISDHSEYVGIHRIDMHTNDYRLVIDEIVKSGKIISSSLHGIILAEAYGVPAVFYNPKGYSLFKFEDYYESTGRKLSVVTKTLEDAVSVVPQELPSLFQMQEKLLSVFPYDLWD